MSTPDDTTATTSTATGSPSFLASGRHPVNIGHLVMGVAFAGLVLVWALVVGDVVAGDDIRWLLPVPWVLAGAAGLVGLIASDRRKVGQRQVGWADKMEE
ncbi:hypothetical protein [Nocardioides sp.]|uniref:hypothetical protein n=1 Tax=Nocardioides sp. TaxID=35761 RepID=UPI002720198B|nr:hypothetical protein [Nocardioides sp.]MDO9456287.1 hypothetical protein [Nocardioides sp.]